MRRLQAALTILGLAAMPQSTLLAKGPTHVIIERMPIMCFTADTCAELAEAFGCTIRRDRRLACDRREYEAQVVRHSA